MRKRYLRCSTFMTGHGRPFTRITSPKSAGVVVVVEEQLALLSNIASLTMSGTS